MSFRAGAIWAAGGTGIDSLIVAFVVSNEKSMLQCGQVYTAMKPGAYCCVIVMDLRKKDKFYLKAIAMPYKLVKEMYPFVREWLRKFLTDSHRKAQVQVFDTSRKSLARLIQDQNLMRHLPPEWPSWDIYVDAVGFIQDDAATQLAFVECKNEAIRLSHLSQLLGYSRVAQPLYAFIIAPQGVSDALKSLLLTFNRLDILSYSYQPGHLSRTITVAKWDETAHCIDNGTLIRGDARAVGRL